MKVFYKMEASMTKCYSSLFWLHFCALSCCTVKTETPRIISFPQSLYLVFRFFRISLSFFTFDATMSPTLTFSAKILSPTWSTRIRTYIYMYIYCILPTCVKAQSIIQCQWLSPRKFHRWSIWFFVSIENSLFAG